uniref:NADH-ubiquinone oxidoreductase chain 2 n=1 Tax=Dyscophus antongilii TaxID=272187 RepID=S4V246_9NEOB|nr:NADH dehydrogenase subunit 2 [Dyscophus antongilii]
MSPMAIFIFISSLATGTTITLASHHWVMAWIGLEINTMAIIPLMTKTQHPRAIEAATKYFLTQAAASALLLFSSLINAWVFGEWNIHSLSSSMSIPITIAICMKLGLAPLHFWLPEVLQGIPLVTGLLLSTWQKIAPMALLIQITHTMNLTLLVTIGLISILVGGWGGINQTHLRKLMAYSSIGHMGWIIIIIKFNPHLALFSFIIYLIMTSAMFVTFIALNSTKLSQLSAAWTKSPTLATISILSLLSLGGLPPLTGFAPKMIITLELVKQNSPILAGMILLISLLALFFYIRLAYILILTMAPNTSSAMTTWRPQMNISIIVTTLHTSSLLLFPMTPTILTFC